MHHHPSARFALSLLTLAVSQAVCAADNPVMLEEVTVVATRTPTPLTRVPASVSVLNQEDFSSQQAATVGDVMKKMPNVNFGGGPRADGQIPTIRGYQGNDIILMVDGARRNANYGLTTPLFLDPYFLSRAEVVRGSASSLYGSGGNGGAMVFTTVSAQELLKPGQQFGGDVRASYGSADRSHRYNARVYGSNGPLDILLAVGVQDANDIRQAGGTTLQLNGGHGSSSLFKLGAQPTDRMRIELSQQSYFKQTLEPNNPQLVTAAQTQLTRNKQDETVLSAYLLNDQGEKAASARIYNTRTSNQRDKNGALAYWNSIVDTTGMSAQATSRLGDGGAHRLTYGIDAYQDRLGTLSGAAANPVNPDGTAKVTGLFLQDEFALNDTWRITPSVRYDRFNTTPNNPALASASNSHVSPKLAVAWQASPSVNLYGSYGQSYRAPTIWETYASTLVGAAYPTTNFMNFAANPNLKPQTDTTLELGGRYVRNDWLAAEDQLKLNGSIFQSKAKNMITNVTIGTFIRTGFLLPGTAGLIMQAQNVAQATRTGMELGGQYRLGQWRVDANYSSLRVKDDTTGANLFAPPDKLATRLGYALPASNLTMSWGMTAVAAQNYDSTVLRQRSGYTVHDVFATWELPHDLRADFAITNVFDKRYLSYQQSLATALTAYEMGRSYNLMLSGSF